MDSESRRPDRAQRFGARLPPGQSPTPDGVWPVLHVEPELPDFDPAAWDFTIRGLVDEPLVLRWEDWRALPRSTVTVDLHCVTAWSSFDNVFEGVLFRDLFARVRARPEARFAMWFTAGDYTTNVPLEDLLRPEVILAESRGGQPIEPRHGGPVRPLVPHLYLWKSCKWPRGFELMAEDRPGYWEERGYHMRGDPFEEERYR